MVSLVVVGLVILVAAFAAPIFAHDPGGGEVTPSDGEAWEEMHQACEDGDYEAMDEWHTQCHSEEGAVNSGMMGMMGGMH